MLIKEIRLQNLLSFGPDTPPLELRPLNVLIGPNGSGKSNLIEAISLLQAAPTDVTDPIRQGGGINDWIWKGNPDASAVIEVNAICTPFQQLSELKHRLAIESTNRLNAFLNYESIERMELDAAKAFRFAYLFERDKAIAHENAEQTEIEWERNTSVVSTIRDSMNYPVITSLGRAYRSIRIFRDFDTGRKSNLRLPVRTDVKADFLEEDLSNLPLVLNQLRREPLVKAKLIEYLKALNESVTDLEVIVNSGTVQAFLHEGGFSIPSTRLSDGTLRYLCLVCILAHPDPPRLICIEEPELGLHPDMMPTIAELLREASTRTQLIVTTHSDILIDALTDTPEDVVVCEKHDGCTTMKRLNKDDLAIWLEKYSLGDLWTSGQIGGNRF